MKNIFKKIGGLCLGLAMLSGVAVGISSGRAQETSAGTISGTLSKPSSDGDYTCGGITWTLAHTGGSYQNVDGTKGLQLGSSNSPMTAFSMTSKSSVNNISSIEVYSSTASSGTAKLTITIGTSKIIDNQSLTTTNTKYSQTLSNATSGIVTFSFSNTAKAFYFKNFKISTQESYSVTYDLNGGSGTLPTETNKSSGTKFNLAASTGLTKTGCTFGGWSDGTKIYAAGAEYTMPSSNVTLTAQWNTIQYSVSPTYINCSGSYTTSSKINYNQTLTDTLIPTTGYHLPTTVSAKVGETTSDYNLVNDKLIISEVLGDVSYTVEAIINTYSVSDSISNGSLSNTSSLNHGTQYSGTITPETGFNLPEKITVKVGATTLDSSLYSYNNESGLITIPGTYVTNNIEISGICYKEFSINSVINNGKLDESSENKIRTGETACIEFTANFGYVVPTNAEDIIVTGAEINDYSDGLLEICNPTDNVNITVNCISVSTYSITVTMDNVSSTGTGSGKIQYGGEAEVTITADSGYRLPAKSSFTITGADASYSFTGTQSVVISLSNCTGDVNISASTIRVFTVSSGTINNGSISFSKTKVDAGDSLTATLTPNDGYKLPNEVTVIGGDQSYDSSTGVVTVSNVNANVVVSANMIVLETYTITNTLTNVTKTTGASTIKENGSETLVFTADSGYGLPESITVNGASFTWNKNTGTLVLSNPTANVSITIVGDADGLQSISLSAITGNYILGEEFKMPTVTANYKYKAATDVTDDATNDFDPFTIGEQNVTISYTENKVTKTASYTATVSNKQVKTNERYELVTENLSDWSGQYLIVYESGSVAFDSSLTTLDAVDNGFNVTINTNNSQKYITHSSTIEGKEWTIQKITEDTNVYYTIKSKSNLYIGGQSSNGMTESSTVTDVVKNSISYSNGTFTIKGNKGSGSKTLSYNNNDSQKRFRYLGTTSIKLYRYTYEQGTADLIRLTSRLTKTGDIFVGQTLQLSDFELTAWYNDGTTVVLTGDELDDVTATGLTMSNVGDNTVEFEYKDFTSSTIVENVKEDTREVESVVLVKGDGYKTSYFLVEDEEDWDFTNISVLVTFVGDSFSPISTPLQTLVDEEEATINPAKASIGVTSYKVNYSYDGHEIDVNTSTVNVTIVRKEVVSLTWNLSSAFNFNVFEGSSFDFDSLGTLVAVWNDGTREPTSGTMSIKDMVDQQIIQIGLWEKYSTTSNPDVLITDEFTWSSTYEGYKMGFDYGYKRTSKNTTFHVVDSLNPINVPSSTVKVSNNYNALNFTGISESYVSDVKTVTNDNIVYEYVNAKGDDTALKISKSSDAYFKNNTKLAGALSKIVINETYDNTTLNVSTDGVNWTILHTAGGTKSGSQTINIDTSKKYYYYKFTSYASYDANISSFTVEYAGKENGANKNINAQNKVVEFSKYMINHLDDVCISFDTKSAAFIKAWGEVKDKYNELFGSSSVWGSAEDKELALNMLLYAYPGARTDETIDVLQQAMKRYDTIVARDSTLDKFITRNGTYENKVVTLSNILSNVSNSTLIIVVVSLTGLTAIGGYFFYKKRKENI